MNLALAQCLPAMSSCDQVRDLVFYDGTCGFCHRWVKFLLARDANGERFRFAPRTGSTFEQRIDATTRAGLPASIIVLTSDGRVLSKSSAVLHLFRKLGGGLGHVAELGSLVPPFLRDAVYMTIAKIRHHLSKPAPTMCPVAAPELIARFDP